MLPASAIFPHMTIQDARIQGWVEGVLDRTRDRLRDDLGQLITDVTVAMAEEQAEAARSARREAETAAAALASEAMAAERAAAEARLAGAVAAARQEAIAEQQAAAASADLAAEREASLAEISGLLDALRALDEAGSITGILNALAEGAARVVPRVAIVLRQQGEVRGWAWRGFGESRDASGVSVALGGAGLVAAAVRSGERQAAAGRDAGVPPLSPVRDDRAALAVPLRVGGVVVGAVYADNDGEGGGVVPSAWPELLESLARHAERLLETATLRGLPELLRAGAAERARRQTEQVDDEAAHRYARLLIAEIKLYHEPLVDEARRERNVLRRLRPQIERAQQLYEERVPADIRARTGYFEEELVRTLADGDPGLLGQPT